MTAPASPYHTTACSGYKLGKIEDALPTAIVNGWIPPSSQDGNGRREIIVLGNDTRLQDIPAFNHPIVLQDAFNKQEKLVVVDARAYMRHGAPGEAPHVKNMPEFLLIAMRGQLTMIQVNESISLLRDVSPMPISIYALWIAESIARRFALEGREKLQIAILAAIFYRGLFEDNLLDDEDRKNRIVPQVSKAVYASADEVFAVMDQIEGKFETVIDLCRNIQKITGTVRLQEFNHGLLYSVLKGTWFGNGSEELVAVALEHVPTWLAMLYYAVNDRSFRKTSIGQQVERQKSEVTSRYVRSVDALIQQYYKVN